MNVESENISLNINIFVPICIKTKGQNMDLDLLFIDNYVTIVLVLNMVFKALYREWKNCALWKWSVHRDKKTLQLTMFFLHTSVYTICNKLTLHCFICSIPCCTCLVHTLWFARESWQQVIKDTPTDCANERRSHKSCDLVTWGGREISF